MLSHNELQDNNLCRPLRLRTAAASYGDSSSRHETCCESFQWHTWLSGAKDGRNDIYAASNYRKRPQDADPGLNQARAPPELLNLFTGGRL